MIHKQENYLSDNYCLYSFQSNGCSVFSEIASNPNACDRPRLIPESVQLQDLKFKVCDSNNVQVYNNL